MVTSGVRIGTPAMTTRGLTRQDAITVANLIADVLDRPTDEATTARAAAGVHELCSKYPVYPADLMG
jgi:glycine hydroxymethyltransferase